ncbi:MAG: LysM peptidoglycan-binding domain-containing protein [Waddliaceae bacterium]|nr:LysM peptidoglycan-binding domain-containing protein [Waddliaceae bacterium]MBT4444266.1 LysM peptidoglycan-binding domain-containing protein [Waddliaceae bacterium]MBT6929220.1 LysM peptidoglycan-binding domain-containing protein [Waddliaceae bacterium]
MSNKDLPFFSRDSKDSGILQVLDNDNPFVIFCDGVCRSDGGDYESSLKGSHAAAIATTAINQHLISYGDSPLDEKALIAAFEAGNEAVRHTFGDGKVAVSGLIIALAKTYGVSSDFDISSNEEIIIAGLGDCRLYDVNDGVASLAFLDTHATNLRPRLSTKERHDALRNILGLDDNIKVYIRRIPACDVGNFVAVSYGLGEHLSKEDLANIGDAHGGKALDKAKKKSRGHSMNALVIAPHIHPLSFEERPHTITEDVPAPPRHSVIEESIVMPDIDFDMALDMVDDIEPDEVPQQPRRMPSSSPVAARRPSWRGMFPTVVTTVAVSLAIVGCATWFVMSRDTAPYGTPPALAIADYEAEYLADASDAIVIDDLDNDNALLVKKVDYLSKKFEKQKAHIDNLKDAIGRSPTTGLRKVLFDTTKDLHNKKALIAQMNADRTSLEQELSDNKEQIKLLSNSIADIQDASSDITSVEGSATTGDDIAALEGTLAEKSQRIEVLGEDLKNLKSLLSDRENKLFMLAEKYSKKKDITDKLLIMAKSKGSNVELLEQHQKEKGSLTSSLNKEIALRKELQESVKDLASSNNEKEVALVKARGELEKMSSEASEASVSFQDPALQEALDKEIALRQEQKSTLDEAKGTLKKLAMRYKDLSDDFSRSKKKLDQDAEMRNSLQSALDKAQSQIEELKNGENAIADLAAKDEEYRQRIEELEDSKESQQRTISKEMSLRSALEQELEDERSKRMKANTSILEAQDLHSVMSAAKATLEKELAMTKALFEERHADVKISLEKELSTSKALLEKETSLHTNEKASFEQKVLSLLQENKVLSDKIIALQTIQQEYSLQKKALDAKAHDLAELEKELTMQKTSLKGIDKARKEMYLELDKIKKDYDTLKQQTPAPKATAQAPVSYVEEEYDVSSWDNNIDKSAITRIHLVSEGETLTKISLQYYGTIQEWEAIYDANKDMVVDKDNIKVGTPLIIP